MVWMAKIYIQESLLSEQAIKRVFVNILLLEDSTASYYKVNSFCIIICILLQYNFFPKCTVIAISFKASQCNGCATSVEENGTRVTVCSEQVVFQN